MHTAHTIFVSGAWTLMGQAIVQVLRSRGYGQLLTPRPGELNIADGAEVMAFLAARRPDYVIVAGVRSGGIAANKREPADFMLANLLPDLNVISAAAAAGVRGLIYLASSCVYPRDCPQPMAPEHLMTGPLEPTSRSYATGKLAAIEFVRANRRQYGLNFLAVIPADVFGPGDSLKPGEAHVVPALISRFHEAKAAGTPAVEVWGTGRPRRELMFAGDAARACVFLAEREAWREHELLNVGCGSDVTIAEAARLIGEVVEYTGVITFDPSKPDGAPQKLLDSSALQALGWRPETPLREAVAATYRWYLTTMTP